MLREIAYGLLGLALAAYSLEYVLAAGDDPREPARLRSGPPLVGHIIGIYRHGMAYFSKTCRSKTTNEEIFTIAIFNLKLYISNSHRLNAFIQKNSKSLSFRPFIKVTVRAFGDASPETDKLFEGALLDDFSHAMKNGLAPGPQLDEQNLRMGIAAVSHVNKLVEKEEVVLIKWVDDAIVQATSAGVYGKNHPYTDPKVVAAFWKWMEYNLAHLFGADITGKGYAARAIVFKAFQDYCRDLPDDCSFVVRERLRTLYDHGVSVDDAAKQEATFSIAAFPNTIPTMYWVLYEVSSRPELLQELRDEISTQAVSRTEGNDVLLDVSALKTKCPLLLGVIQETQRTRHMHANIRKVMQDTVLDGKYLLKAGNYVQMPGAPIHASAGIWGPTTDAFDPKRFLPKPDSDRASGSFMAWGAAPHLCPARQFATTEVMLITAMLVLRVDLRPTEPGGWERNPKVRTDDSSTLGRPLKELLLRVEKRDGWQGGWKLEMGESRTRISLASG
ncbi:hypothetical protein S7711_04747 [Stachybotrys chartarum IBT 7711]|uniref:Cytochrome P450 n=1 Tax=Stachybotrys chartarum (strain CBS 109288 / IBT 7711) TaxID=1280523 RepID=A0A084ASD1_STACB|nr:hypothetical protein S7711_04747 [Stachybotrys chartarum IBT 7711]